MRAFSRSRELRASRSNEQIGMAMVVGGRSRLRAYLLAVSVIGLPLLALAGWDVSWPSVSDRWPAILVASAFLIVGELWPIPISRGANAGDELSISSTLAVALLFFTDPGVACLAQATALLVQEARERRNWERLAFNMGQYTLALLATRAVFAALVGQPTLGHPVTFTPGQLAPALVSCAAFTVVNGTLTGIAVAISTRLPIRRLVAADLRSHLPTDGVLLVLAPVVAQALTWSVVILPLLMVPLIAVHRSARLAAQREHEALHDALTGLPNRAALLLRLRQACDDLTGVSFAVMMVDLDHFKEINDTLGHFTGDQLLIEVARRWRADTRDGDLVARLGGDEFAILSYHVDNDVAALEVASRLQDALAAAIPLAGAELNAQCSIGIAIAGRDGTDADTLLKRADVALYDAKTRRGSASVYDNTRDGHTIERINVASDLRRAIDTGAVFPLFQPLCLAATGEIVGVEALARWRTSTRTVPPAEFLDIAESAGLLATMTYSLLDQALACLTGWHRAGHLIGLSINVSPRTVRERGFVDTIGAALARHGIEPRWLTIEITETAMIGHHEGNLEQLAELRRLGCRISIDDFGTGYSSMAYLKDLPADDLKIDKSFVSGLGHDPRDEVIIRSITDLAHRFDLTVTAEGVENDFAWALLREIGCDRIQGYRLARPLTAGALSAWLTTVHAAPADPVRLALRAI